MAGTVTVTERSSGNPSDGHIFCKTVHWTADASGVVDTTIGSLQGEVLQVNIRPNTDSAGLPDDGYDMTITDPFGYDVLGGAGIDCSNTTSTHFCVQKTGHQSYQYLHWEPSDGDTLVKRGKGILHNIFVAHHASTAGVITLRDGTNASGTKITDIYMGTDAVYFIPASCVLDIEFTDGLYIDTDGILDGGDIVVAYRPRFILTWLGQMTFAVANAGNGGQGYIDIYFRK